LRLAGGQRQTEQQQRRKPADHSCSLNGLPVEALCSCHRRRGFEPQPRMSDETRLIHAGSEPQPLARTVGPPIQKGSTILLPNAEALYDDDGQLTYGRAGLAAQAALQEALAVLEGAVGVSLYPSGIAAISGALLAVLKT